MFELCRVVQGVPLVDHYSQVEKAGGYVEELHFAPLQYEICDELWRNFLDLARTRPSGMGLGAICYQEIWAWSRLTQTTLQPWEVRALMELDKRFIAITSRKDDD